MRNPEQIFRALVRWSLTILMGLVPVGMMVLIFLGVVIDMSYNSSHSWFDELWIMLTQCWWMPLVAIVGGLLSVGSWKYLK